MGSQGDKLHRGVYLCHKEFKITLAHPIFSSRTFSGINYYSKPQIHPYVKMLLLLKNRSKLNGNIQKQPQT